jgi:tetratricopeptide (TPR) repeat protein
MTTNPQQRPCRIFISYSHEDEVWKDRLVSHLDVLAGEGLEVWDDRRVAAGDDWLPEIQRAIAGCDVAVLLISRYFLTSKFIRGQEIPPLLQRRQTQGVRVIPLIIRPCQWERLGWLNQIQARPTDGKALLGMDEHQKELALSELTGEIADLAPLVALPAIPTAETPPRIDFSHLPAGAEYFFGREEELAVLNAAWADSSRSHVVELVAPGGVGKSSLVKRWLENMSRDGWRGAQRVYAWSFYSQGTSHDRQASDDGFLSAALAWFGVELDPATNPWDKGQRLAEAVATSRTLLVLDGVEPLQYPPGPLAGELRAPGLKALLECLTSVGQPGLCLVTSRERLTDLAQYERNDSRPEGAVLRRKLDNLGEADGARLLHVLGANKAGSSTVASDDEELKAASREVRGHALTLSLLGRYLALAYAGDIRQRDQVDFQEADDALDGGHAFKVIAAYENWFVNAGKNGERELAALRLLGFFDYPASLKSLRALRQPPALPEVTRPLVNLKATEWQATLQRLVDCGLAFYNEDKTTLDAHPLVREYQAKALQTRFRLAWQQGNKLLYKFLAGSVKHHPDDLVGLQSLYQAVVHGCRAGLYEETLAKVYHNRILRGTEEDGFYTTRKLGAFGANLGAVACFFVEPWQQLVPDLAVDKQAWLLGEAAFSLRALGRLAEALEPMRAGAEIFVAHAKWENAAVSYSNLSELQLSLGHIELAITDAKRSVDYADRSGDEFQRISKRTTLANARHQQGDREAARCDFAEAESMQSEDQPEYPLLYSLQGFRYCDLLLAEAERAAWGRSTAGNSSEACAQVAERGRKLFEWRKPNDPLLDIALEHLTLARCALYTDLLHGRSPDDAAQQHAEAAVTNLRQAGVQHHLPRGLLTRAWLRHCLDDLPGAEADLAEAQRIAERGGMKLYLADIALTSARLFDDKAELAKARALIEECGYGRRLPELEDAERRLGLRSMIEDDFSPAT